MDRNIHLAFVMLNFAGIVASSMFMYAWAVECPFRFFAGIGFSLAFISFIFCLVQMIKGLKEYL